MLLTSEIMKILYNILVSLLLVFNGVGALIGGWLLITQPDGSALKLSLDLLKHTPFHNFLIPGIILFVVKVYMAKYENSCFKILGTSKIHNPMSPSLTYISVLLEPAVRQPITLEIE